MRLKVICWKDERRKKKEQMEYSGAGRTRLSKHRWGKHKSREDGGGDDDEVVTCTVKLQYYLSLIYWSRLGAIGTQYKYIQIYTCHISYVALSQG